MSRTVDPFPTSGLQSVERDAVMGRTGTPGVCLRWVDQQSPNVPMLPGMGKILIDADSDTGREILAYFPTEAFGPRRRTVASVDAFLGRPEPDVRVRQGAAAGKFQGGL